MKKRTAALIIDCLATRIKHLEKIVEYREESIQDYEDERTELLELVERLKRERSHRMVKNA